jgi:pimeloyl-ACP methyl ester carboxylesterase
VSSLLERVGDLEGQPDATIAVQRVMGGDGVSRYVVVLTGMRQIATSADPEDLLGAAAALTGTTTNYTRSVVQALDAARVPQGAQVVLVGHSEGGLVAMDLAGDRGFNGGRVRVAQVIAAGAPISSKVVVPGSGTRVLSIENVNDVVTHLDAVDPALTHQTVDRLTYQFAIDERDVVRSHDVLLYARQATVLADSPNPLMIEVRTGLQPFSTGSASTTVYALHDHPAPPL